MFTRTILRGNNGGKETGIRVGAQELAGTAIRREQRASPGDAARSRF